MHTVIGSRRRRGESHTKQRRHRHQRHHHTESAKHICSFFHIAAAADRSARRASSIYYVGTEIVDDAPGPGAPGSANEKEGDQVVGPNSVQRCERGGARCSGRVEHTQRDDTTRRWSDLPRPSGGAARDCRLPHATLAEALLRVTLDELGLTRTPVYINMIETTAEAIHQTFVGSPTIRINGVDPWAQSGSEPGLACRVHPSPAGLPTQYSLAQALCAAVVNDQLPMPADSQVND